MLALRQFLCPPAERSSLHVSNPELFNCKPQTQPSILTNTQHYSRALSGECDPQITHRFPTDFHPLSLDPFTAHQELSLSETNRAVSRTGSVQSYPDHPDRFDVWGQALCREAVGGRGYWEAEWEGLQVELGLAYEDIARKGSGNDCGLGRNSLSWSLRCNASSHAFYHDNQMTPLEVSSTAISRKIGVFLDQRAGLLCFYSVTAEKVTLLHMVQTSFSQPLYPAVWLGARSSITLCSPE